MKKNSLLIGLVLSINLILPSKAISQDPVTAVQVAGYIYAAGKYAYQAGKIIQGNFWHNWTMCEYESGFRIYNRFKAKRSYEEITNYYLYGGDGDSFYGACDGNEKHVNLPNERNSIVNIHGPVIRITYLRDPPSCKRDNIIKYIDRYNTTTVWTITCNQSSNSSGQKPKQRDYPSEGRRGN
jgi:hypothetical protein